MASQSTTECNGGISRSGRVRKKSTKLMESLEIGKNPKPDRPMMKLSPDKKSPVSGLGHGPELMSIKVEPDYEETYEEQVMEDTGAMETIVTERLPLSAEGLPLAVPASGYYTYQGQFSDVLPKSEPKFMANQCPKDVMMSPTSDGELKQSDFLLASVVKQEVVSPTESMEISTSDAAGKKKKAKFKDKSWDADWEKMKKKKKKKKEKEKQLKAMKGDMGGEQSSQMMHLENEDSNSSLGLVIAEPTITLPPKKRKSGSDKKSPGEAKKKNANKKAKKAPSVPVEEEFLLNVEPDPNITVKLEQLAEGGSIDDPDMVPAAEEKVVGSQYLADRKRTKKRKEKFVVGPDGKVTAKKKRPRPITAYMLWCKENRPKIVAEDPSKGRDFAAISRKMGKLWQKLTDKEKMMYRRRAKKMGRRGFAMISTGKKGSAKQMATGSKSQMSGKIVSPVADHVSASKLGSPVDLVPVYKIIGTDSIDVAAHLKLLGESLTIIGQRLTEHEGQIAVSGSLSVLLDSTICALGPLFCLTNRIEEIGEVPQDMQTSCLDSIAYIMPGL